MLRSVLLGSHRLSMPFGVLFRGTLPRRVRATVVDLDAERPLGVGLAGHLAALGPGEDLGEARGLAGTRGGDRRPQCWGVVAVGQRRGGWCAR